MSSAALVTMVVVGGIVWGGFVLIAVAAVRKESRKSEEA